jgi:ABC-type glycerol-3-phosphate transport system permease component
MGVTGPVRTLAFALLLALTASGCAITGTSKDLVTPPATLVPATKTGLVLDNLPPGEAAARRLLMGFFKTMPVEIEEAAIVDRLQSPWCFRQDGDSTVAAGHPDHGDFHLHADAAGFRVRPYLHLLYGGKACYAGVATDLIRGDIFFWGEIMTGALIASIPVASAYNSFLDRFIEGITSGTVK